MLPVRVGTPPVQSAYTTRNVSSAAPVIAIPARIKEAALGDMKGCGSDDILKKYVESFYKQ